MSVVERCQARVTGQEHGTDRCLFSWGTGNCFNFLLSAGAQVTAAMRDTGETSLHSALSQTEQLRHNQVVRVVLEAGANPNKATKKKLPTGAVPA